MQLIAFIEMTPGSNQARI